MACDCGLNGCRECDPFHVLHDLNHDERRAFFAGIEWAAKEAEDCAEMWSDLGRDAQVAREVAGYIRSEAETL